ncbi:MAG: S9 family peptidase [Polyangiaceae bacterium]
MTSRPTALRSMLTAVPAFALAACGAHGGSGPQKLPESPHPTLLPAPPSPAPVTGDVDGPKFPRPSHPFDFADMVAMERVEELTIAPDGKRYAFTIKAADVGSNTFVRTLWIGSTDGTAPRAVSSPAAKASSPRFSADGNRLFFLEGETGTSQLVSIHPDGKDGNERTRLTNLPVDVEGFVPFDDGVRFALVLSVFPDAATLKDSKAKDDAERATKSKVRTYEMLPIRHWDAWDDGKRSHIFVWKAGSEPVDLMRGLPDDAPPKPFGGVEEIAVSKDGKDLVFTSKRATKDAAWSTNSDLWVVPTDGSAKPKNLTEKNLGEDSHPVFSPDGKSLAFLSMARPIYESDKRRIRVIDWATKSERGIADAWDRSPTDIVWSADGKGFLATADHLGSHALFTIPLEGGAPTAWPVPGANNGVVAAGDTVLWLHDSLREPADVWMSDAKGGAPKAITHVNEAITKTIVWGVPEAFTFKGAKGDVVHAWFIKPAGYVEGTKVPMATLIHGGPQGSLGDHFHYRWNPSIFAGHGYATLMIDFHGSTGYGQAFTDAIRGDWGGAPYEDLMKGVDAALAKYTFVDKDRVVALGASYGGFMINWINGKTDRFKALVCHDGNLDEPQAYFETEELWFPEWEHGKTPWENPTGYAKHNPRDHVKDWKTPTLVIHGGLDFRVVDTQGMGTFTALQRRGIPSRFVHFPDENHWVLKPANSKRWHSEVFGWIDRYAMPKDAKTAADAPKPASK